MYKKDLLNLPKVSGYRANTVRPYTKKYKYILAAQVHKVNNSDILRVLIYHINSHRLNFELFIDRDNKRIYNLIHFKNSYKWSNATIINLVDCYLCDIYSTDNTDKLVSQYFGKTKEMNKSAIYLIFDFQNMISDYKLMNNYRNSQKFINDTMGQVDELPKDINSFLLNTVFRQSKYGYYKRINNLDMVYYCEHCKNEYIIPIQKGNLNNKVISCKGCKTKLKFRHISKTSLRTYDDEFFGVFQKIGNGIIYRYFKARKIVYKDFLKEPEIIYNETFRMLYNGKNFYCFEKYDYTSSGIQKTSWLSNGLRSLYGYVYTKNLNLIFKNTEFQYSQIYSFCKNVWGVRFPNFFRKYLDYPQIEYLIKFKFFNLVHDIVEGEFSYSNRFNFPNDLKNLGLSRNDFKDVQKIDISSEELFFWRYCRSNNININIKVILEIRKLKNISNNRGYHIYDNLRDVFHNNTKINKIISYFKNLVSKENNLATLLGDYHDYLSACKILNYNMQDTMILYPKKFKDAHDITIKKLKLKKNKHLNASIKRIYKELKYDYYFEDKEFFIRIAKSTNEIIVEGTKLSHCVGQYVDKVADGTCIIAFVRKKNAPNEPYYTIEIRNYQIWQCRGLRNCNTTDEVKAFVEKYKKILKKLKDEERVKVAI